MFLHTKKNYISILIAVVLIPNKGKTEVQFIFCWILGSQNKFYKMFALTNAVQTMLSSAKDN